MIFDSKIAKWSLLIYALILLSIASLCLLSIQAFVLTLISYVILEIVCHRIFLRIRKHFQWLIMSKDKRPHFDSKLLDKYFADGFDPELGWSRKPSTSKAENGKYGQTQYHIDATGARLNPGHQHLPVLISSYGDSFTFGRQVNDHETFQSHLSSLTKTNVLNYGVGNYGFDQALLRLKREFPKAKSKYVLMGVVPSTIVRILSVWKHYNEFGNILAFKPRYKLVNNTLTFVPNRINSREKFENYSSYLSEIQQNDDFYKTKFLHEMLHFPYGYSLMKAYDRHGPLLKALSQDSKTKDSTYENAKAVIMENNLNLRVQLFKDHDAVSLLLAMLDEFVNYARQEGFNPIFLWLPQKDDIISYRTNNRFYNNFLEQAKQKLAVIDMTERLLPLNNLDHFYSDDSTYGGHFSKEGNQLVAEKIFAYFTEQGLFQPFVVGADVEKAGVE